MIQVEVCAGSVEDCIIADRLKVDRIELNNGLYLGGLTPSLATLVLAKQHTNIPIVTMVRPRGGGFHYNDIEIKTMFEDAKMLLEKGADGIAFGFLTSDHKVDQILTLRMVNLCHKYNAEAVFHRAIDVVDNLDEAMQILIDCDVDRVLTSGQATTASEGKEVLFRLKQRYGENIEILMGSGLNAENVIDLVKDTGINQVHGSFKGWYQDATTQTNTVSYSYSHLGDYDGVSENVLKAFMEKIKPVD